MLFKCAQWERTLCLCRARRSSPSSIRHPTSSYIISARYTSTSHFVIHYCASSSLYLAVVCCRHQVTKQTIVFWVNA